MCFYFPRSKNSITFLCLFGSRMHYGLFLDTTMVHWVWFLLYTATSLSLVNLACCVKPDGRAKYTRIAFWGTYMELYPVSCSVTLYQIYFFHFLSLPYLYYSVHWKALLFYNLLDRVIISSLRSIHSLYILSTPRSTSELKKLYKNHVGCNKSTRAFKPLLPVSAPINWSSWDHKT